MDGTLAPDLDRLLDEPMQQHTMPMLVIPYVRGISERLKNIATRFDVKTWFMYPGRTMDQLMQHRGKVHRSKARFSIYCASCACGVQYVGETEQNLKLRLSEHLRNSSTSAFSGHILQDNAHRAVLNSTQILAREKHPQKRKIIENVCIENKKSKLCNNSVSVELPEIWKMCAPEVAKQVAYSD